MSAPLVAGSRDIARRIVNGGNMRLMVFGDSTTPMEVSFSRWRVPKLAACYNSVVNDWGPSNSAGTTTARFSGDAGNALGLSHMNYAPLARAVETVYNGGTLGGADGTTVNNKIHLYRFKALRKKWGGFDATEHCGLGFNTSFLKRVKDRNIGFNASMFFYANTLGTTAAQTYLEFDEFVFDNRADSSAAKFATFAASAGYLKKTIAVPAGSVNSLDNYFVMQCRMADSTVTENAKNTISLGVAYDTGEVGFGVYGSGVQRGGDTLQTYLDTNNFSVAAIASLCDPAAFGFTDVLIQLGINSAVWRDADTVDGGTGTSFRQDLLAFIARLRTNNPAAGIILVAPHEAATTVANAASYAQVMYEVAIADGNALFLNLYETWGSADWTYLGFGELGDGTDGNFWTSDALYAAGDIVLYNTNSTYYLAKQSQSGVTPGTDSSVWLALSGMNFDNTTRYLTEKNYHLRDGIHHTKNGALLWGDVTWGLIAQHAAAAGIPRSRIANA